MISGNENLADIFNIFHDGGIPTAALEDESLAVEVDISYLAERVDPSYEQFFVTFQKVRALVFNTWPKDRPTESAQLTSSADIFAPSLEILSAEVKDESIVVYCNADFHAGNYSGGELRFKADSAIVRDQGGREYTLEELIELCQGYWDEWSAKKPKS